MNKIKIQGVLFLIVLIVAFFVYVFQGNQLRPTREFYVNDYAQALSPAIENVIVEKGVLLYDLYQDVDEVGGAQIVFLTLDKATYGNSSSTELTEIFNKWKIGKNDMGLLYVIFFEEVEYDGYTLMEYDSIRWIIGNQMKIYLSASKIGQIVDATIQIEDSLNMGIAKLLHETLREITTNAYDYEDFSDFDEEAYAYYFDNYTGSSTDAVEMNVFYYLFSSHSSFTDKLFAVIPFLLIMFMGGLFVSFKGGGGSSGGSGSFRRRR